MALAAVRADVSAACQSNLETVMNIAITNVRLTLLLGRFSIFLYTLLSNKCTSVKTNLSSRRFNSVSKVSISWMAAPLRFASSNLNVICKETLPSACNAKLYIQTNETDFQAVLQENTLLGSGPFDVVL